MNTSLPENFLKDLEDLEENSNDENFSENDNNDLEIPKNKGVDVEMEIEQLKKDFEPKEKEISSLITDHQFISHMKKVQEYVESKNKIQAINPEDPEYITIMKSNEYVNIIDREINSVHKYIKDLYFKKFPDLESLVLNPVDYAECVKIIKNEVDLYKVDFSNLLTNHQAVAVTVSGSSTNGKLLSKTELANVLEACDILLILNNQKNTILNYVETRMKFIAPNLSNLVGSTVAAQLLAAAGGLVSLSKIPACNIQVIGSQKKNLLGMSKIGQKLNLGFFGHMEMVKRAPTAFQIRLVRMLSTNSAKCSRIDVSKLCPDGTLGNKLKDDMLQRFLKIQERPQPKIIKPLPIPQDKPRKKRGGKRFRSLKAKLAMTEIRKYQNRLKFGAEAEQEFREGQKGFGMIGIAGLGKVKLPAKDSKLALSKKQKQRLLKSRANPANPGGPTSGLSSSIVFTPVQGIELINPDIAKRNNSSASEIYFNKESGFKTVLAEKQGLFDKFAKK